MKCAVQVVRLFKNGIFVAVVSLTTSGCERGFSARELGVGTGTAVGAGVGALVGHKLGSTGAGVAVGAASGALIGGLIGNETDNLSVRASNQNERLQRQQEELDRQRREIEDLRRQEYYDSSYRSGKRRVYGDPDRRLELSTSDDFRVPSTPEMENLGEEPSTQIQDRTGYERY